MGLGTMGGWWALGVLVLGSGAGGLKALEVEEEARAVGASLRMRPADCRDARHDVLFLLDTSGSQETVFREQRELALELVEDVGSAGPGTAVGLVQFDQTASVLQSLGDGADVLASQAHLRRLRHTGGPTGTDKAIDVAVAELESFGRPSARRTIVLFNDGHSQASWDRVMESERVLRAAAAEVFVVALAEDQGPELPYYTLDRPDRLYGPADKHRLRSELRSEIGSAGCSAPASLFSTDEETYAARGSGTGGCEGSASLFVVLDSSGSVDVVLQAQKDLAARAARRLVPPADLTLLHYSDVPQLRLTEERDVERVVSEVESLTLMGGETRTAAAVDLLVAELRRQRPQRPIVLLLTDGHSQDAREVVEQTAAALHKETTDVFVAALSPSVDSDELVRYAGALERVFGLGREEELLRALAAAACEPPSSPTPPPRKDHLLPRLLTAPPRPRPLFQTVPDFQKDEGCAQAPAELVLVLDTSASMESVFLEQRKASYALVEGLGERGLGGLGLRVGLVAFSAQPRLLISLREAASKRELLNAIARVAYTGGETDLVAGVETAGTELEGSGRSGAPSLLLLFSDGHSRNRWSRVLSTAQRLRDHNTTVLAVSHSRATNVEELAVYTGSRGRVYQGGANRARLAADLHRELGAGPSEGCGEPRTTERPWVAPSVDAGDCATPLRLDLHLLVDASNSLQQDFPIQKVYAGKVVKTLSALSNVDLRTSVVSYSARPILELSLDTPASREQVLDVIRGISYVGDSTNTSAAVELLLGEVERTRVAGRASLVVLLNDGASQDSWDVVKATSARLRGAVGQVLALALADSVYFPELIHYTGSESLIYDRSGAEQLMVDLVRRAPGRPDCALPPPHSTQATPAPILIAPNRDCEGGLDVVVVLDGSGSVGGGWERERRLAGLFLDALPADSRVGIAAIAFADQPHLHIPLQASFLGTQVGVLFEDKISRADLREYVGRLEQPGGSSSLAQALEMVIEQLRSRVDPQRRAVVAIFSDGKSEDSSRRVEETGRALQATGALVLAASHSPFVSEAELAHYTGSRDTLFLRQRATALVDLVGELRLCQAPRQTPPQTPEPTEACDLDVVFVFDTADKNGSFRRAKGQAAALVDAVGLGGGRVRAALVAFGQEPRLVHGLRDPADAQVIKGKMAGLMGSAVLGSVVEGVQLGLGEVLGSQRPGAGALIVLLSDGASRDTWEQVRKVAGQAERSGVRVLALGDSGRLRRAELLQLTTRPERLFTDAERLGERLRLLHAQPHCVPAPPRLPGAAVPGPEVGWKRDCAGSLDVVYIVEASITLADYQASIRQHLRSLPFGSKVSVAVIEIDGSRVRTILDFTDDSDKVSSALETMGPGLGQPSLAEGVRRASELVQGRPAGSGKLAVVVGSGRWSEAAAEVESVFRGAQAAFDSVLVRANGAPSPLLIRLADTSRKTMRYFGLPGEEGAFQQAFARSLAETTCLETLRPPTPLPSTTSSPSESPLPPLACDAPMDLVIVLDASGSVEAAFAAQKAAAVTALERLPLGKAAVALLLYSTDPRIVLPLQTGRTKDQLKGAVEGLEWEGGETGTGAAVGVALEELKRAGRREARPLLLLFHDGYSQDPWPRVQASAAALGELAGLERFVVALPDAVYDPELLLYAAHPSRVYRRPDLPKLHADLEREVRSGCGLKIDQPPVVETKAPTPVTTATPTTTSAPPSRPPPTTATTIPQPDVCKSKLQVVFLLDASGSSSEIFERQRTVALDLLGMLPLPPASEAVRVGLVEFSERRRVLLRPSRPHSRQAAMAALGNTTFQGGNTATAAAVEDAVELLREARSPDTRSVAVLLTDGHSQDPWQRVRSAGEELRSVADEVFAVGLADDVYVPELRLYAQRPQNVFRGDTVPDFVTRIRSLLAETAACGGQLRSGALDSPAHQSAPQDDAGAAEDCGPADVLFLVDGSGSMGAWGLEKEKALVLGAVDRLRVGRNATQVALAQFAGEARSRLVFPFSAFRDKAGLRSGVRSLGLGAAGVTRLDRAVELAESAFSAETGARDGARRVVVLLSDGYSSVSPAAAGRRLRASGAAVLALGVRRSAEARLNPSGLLDVAGHHSRVFLAHQETLAAYEALAQLTEACV